METMAPPPIPIADATSRDRIINRVVVGTVDRRRLRGFVYDLGTSEETFHLFSTENPSDSRSEMMSLDDCKAIYFVRSHTGNPNYRENKTELAKKKRFGRPYRVTFCDGEVIVGTVEVYHPDRLGFYLIPPDPKSNNLRIFVVLRNTIEVVPLDPDGKGSGHGEWATPDPATYPASKRVEVVTRHLRGKGLRDLSLEVFLPPRVIHHWRNVFVAEGGAALSNAALAADRVAEDPARAGEKPDRYRPAERLDMVLRLFQDESQAVVSQVFLVPFKVLAEWRERFLAAGTAALHSLAEEDSRKPLLAAQEFYESLPDPDAPPEESDMEDFLDGLSKSVGS